jgi:hypothetical protein
VVLAVTPRLARLIAAVSNRTAVMVAAATANDGGQRCVLESRNCGDSAFNSRCHRNSALDVLHREIGALWRQQRIPKRRATADEDGQYRFAVAL